MNTMTDSRRGPYSAVYGKRRDGFEVARRRMVSEQIVRGGVTDERVLKAMGAVQRHEFVGKGMQDQAYMDRPPSHRIGTDDFPATDCGIDDGST